MPRCCPSILLCICSLYFADYSFVCLAVLGLLPIPSLIPFAAGQIHGNNVVGSFACLCALAFPS